VEHAQPRLVVELRCVGRDAIRRLDQQDVTTRDDAVFLHEDRDVIGIQRRFAELHFHVALVLPLILGNLTPA
jgi:hypothetical protein